MKSKLLIIIILYLQAKWLNLFPNVWTQMKETTTNVRIWESCWSWIDCSKLKVTNNCVWFISSSEHMVSYPRKESVVYYPCFTRQQAKNTGNRFAVNSSMNGTQLKKYLWANAESAITVPLSRIRKKLDSLICTKYTKSKNCSLFSDSWYSRGNTGISALISGLGGWCLSFLCCLIVLPKFSLRRRFAMVVAAIFANSLGMMRCGGSSEASAVSLILLFTLVNSTLAWEGGWVCSFNCSLSPKSPKRFFKKFSMEMLFLC